MGTLWRDIRYGLRMLARSPGFTAIVILVLAVGIGGTTAVFSVVNAVVLQPLPCKDSDRIVIFQEQKQGRGFISPVMSPRNFTFLREQSQSFEHLAAYWARALYVTGIDRPHQVRAITVSPNLFPLLGVQPLLGRVFLPEEEQPGNDRVVVLSYAFWRDHLAATPEAIGKSLTLDNESYTIVGVMPPEFRFGFKNSSPFWLPLVPDRFPVFPIARLKKGVTLENARAEMAVLTDRLRKMDSAANAELTVELDQLLDWVLGSNRRLLWLMLGAVGCVLLIACSNVANLFLARAGVRQREMATRVALGASRARVVRQMLTESLVLSMGAGLLGLVVTFWAVKGLVRLSPANIPRLQETHVDTSVLIFAIGLSLLTGLLFGVMPAWRASDVRSAEALKEGRGSSGGGRGWRRLRSGLVVTQIGASLVLLTGAGLLIRTLIAVQEVDLGFRADNVLAVCIELPRVKYPERRHCKAFYEPLVQQVRALPGVRAAGLVSGGLNLGTGGGYDAIRRIDDRPLDGPDHRHVARCISVGPGFFEAMGIRVLSGRTFTDQDMQADSRFAVIDENLARTYFPDTDPIGRRINGLSIVGVVSTLRDFETLSPTHDTYFTPLSDRYFQIGSIVVRTQGDPMRLAGAIRSQVSALDKDQSIAKLETLEATLSGMLAPRRFVMVLLGLFAGIAMILATIGVYGLLQYNTTQQTHDIGIRMALGARGIDVLRTVLVQGLRLTLAGIAVGLAGALALTRILTSLLYDVTPTDPVTLAFVSLILTAAAALASYLPARRAARIDPMEALRYE